MENQKPVQFNGTAGGYFVVFLVTLVTTYIPVLGWAFGFNFTANWMAENSLVNGKKVVYKAGYGETLKFIFINTLLLIITLGIYVFWFTPKSYRYMVDYISYADEAAPVPVPITPVAPAEPEAPAAPQPVTDVPPSPAPTEPASTPPTNPTPPSSTNPVQ